MISNPTKSQRGASEGQAMVEYALLLGMSTGIVIAGLWYFISAGYHKKVFDFWSEPLGKSVEVEVPGEGE